MNIRELAAEYLTMFEVLERTDGTKTWKRKDEYQNHEDLQPLCQDAHDDMFPDDHVYNFIVDALSTIADADEDADLEDLAFDIEPDIYNHDLLRWLSSHSN